MVLVSLEAAHVIYDSLHSNTDTAVVYASFTKVQHTPTSAYP